MPEDPKPDSRLLSAMRRRIWSPLRDFMVDGEKHTQMKPDAPKTYASLLRAGWTPYFGPGEADSRGWVVPGSDPTITPVPSKPRQI